MNRQPDPSYQLWQLRQYLNRYKPSQQTILVDYGHEQAEYAFTEGYKLGDEFAQTKYPPSTAFLIASMGLDPMTRGRVYGYIINRRPEFVDSLYGWGVPR